MPQFDFYSFSTQVFYVLLGFIVFHFFILNYIIISYAQVLKLRQKLFDTFLLTKVVSGVKAKKTYDSIFVFFFNVFKL